ncbi:MAG: LamG-like jellyroll fold domain-containing protein [Planctomycetota bacterium]
MFRDEQWLRLGEAVAKAPELRAARGRAAIILLGILPPLLYGAACLRLPAGEGRSEPRAAKTDHPDEEQGMRQFGMCLATSVAFAGSASAENHVLRLPPGGSPSMVIAHDPVQFLPAQSGALTVEFWIVGTGVAGDQGRPVSKRGCSTAGITIQFRPQGVLQAELGGLCDYPVSFTVGRWTHYAVTLSSATDLVKVYINGVQSGSTVAGTDTLEQIQTELRFGERCGQTTFGAMDNIRIWSVARTQEEIVAEMTLEYTPAQAAQRPGLVGAWSFEQANPLVDDAGRNPIGSLAGSASIVVEDFDTDRDGVPNTSDPCPSLAGPLNGTCAGCPTNACGTCAPTCCLGDVDYSTSINGVDLAIILQNWGTASPKYPQADITGDGAVNGSDLAIVLSGWGTCP